MREKLKCCVCGAQWLSDQDGSTDWRAMDVGGQRFYFCPNESPKPGASAEEFAAAKKRNQEHALKLLAEMPEMKCQVCGCTDSKPCMTGVVPILEPCAWISPGVLCSACVDKVPLPGNQEELLKAMEPLATEIVQFNVPGLEAFQLLSLLHLCYRHPEIGDSLRGFIEAFGRGLQARIGLTPQLAAMLEVGWHDEKDVPVELHREAKRTGRILVPGRDF